MIESVQAKRCHLSKVKSKGTKPERMIAAVLMKLGARFDRNVASIPGSPDIVIRGVKKAIFVHGCFWHRHGCKKSSTPKTNQNYWIPKFARNVQRDRKVLAQLKRRGWIVLILWECKLSDGRSLFQMLRRFLNQAAPLRRVKKRRLLAKPPIGELQHNHVEASGVGKRF
jgi:DNA mismatch endonuclease (patch repair protein)